jgi:RNA polymerase sigma factor (sigma-70 family)
MSARAAGPHDVGAAASEFSVFYSNTVQSVFDSVRRAAGGDKHVAEEATQLAYVEMLRCWTTRQAMAQPLNRRYVLGIAMHKLADQYRRLGRFDELGEEHLPDPCDPFTDRIVDESALLQAVRDFLARQKPRQRTVGVLFFLEDYTCLEIAKLLRVTPSTVRTHVQRLRQQLRPLAQYVTRHDDGDGGEPA